MIKFILDSSLTAGSSRRPLDAHGRLMERAYGKITELENSPSACGG